jgi:hypothetical protein
MAKPVPKLQERVWLRPLYEKDGNVFFAICGEDSAGKLVFPRLRAKTAHVFATSANVRSVVRRPTFSVHYRLKCDFGAKKFSRFFSIHKLTGGRYAKSGWEKKNKQPLRIELLSLCELQASKQALPKSLSTWANCLCSLLKPSGLAQASYGGKLTRELAAFVHPFRDLEPVLAEELQPAHVGLDVRYDFLARLGSWVPCAHAAALKVAFDPAGRFSAMGPKCLVQLDALPHVIGGALKTLLLAAQECQNHSTVEEGEGEGLRGGSSDARALSFATHVRAQSSTGGGGGGDGGSGSGDAGYGLKGGAAPSLLWGPPRPQTQQLGASPSGACWYGLLRDAPAGLLAAPLQGGGLAFYLHTKPDANEDGAVPAAALQLLYDARSQERGGAVLDLSESTPVHCLSAAPDGSACPVSLEHASAFPFVLDDALVDAADAGWSDAAIWSLLACFHRVTIFNQDADDGGSAFEQRLRLLAGRQAPAADELEVSAVPSPGAAPRPAVEEDIDEPRRKRGASPAEELGGKRARAASALAAAAACADAAEAEQARAVSDARACAANISEQLVASQRAHAATQQQLAEQALALNDACASATAATERADAAEAEQARLAARIDGLLHELRDTGRSMHRVQEQSSALREAVSIKRERLQDASTAEAAATSKAASAEAACRDAERRVAAAQTALADAEADSWQKQQLLQLERSGRGAVLTEELPWRPAKLLHNLRHGIHARLCVTEQGIGLVAMEDVAEGKLLVEPNCLPNGARRACAPVRSHHPKLACCDSSHPHKPLSARAALPRTHAAGMSIPLTAEQVASLPLHVRDMINDFCPAYTKAGADGTPQEYHDVPECGFNAMDISWFLNSSADVSHMPGASQLRETVEASQKARDTDVIFRYPKFRVAKGGIKKGEQAAWTYAFTMPAAEQR